MPRPTADQTEHSLPSLRLLGRHSVLNFANTIDPREGPHQIEYLHNYQNLVAWALRAKLISASQARRLAALATENGAQAERAFHRALDLREAVYRVFLALATGKPAKARDLDAILAHNLDAIAHATMRRSGARFEWQLGQELDVIRWLIARQAVSLLESGTMGRVKRCPGLGDCGWLFFDTSKNGTARWCSMNGCGNRAKVRRFLRRQRHPRQKRVGD